MNLCISINNYSRLVKRPRIILDYFIVAIQNQWWYQLILISETQQELDVSNKQEQIMYYFKQGYLLTGLPKKAIKWFV